MSFPARTRTSNRIGRCVAATLAFGLCLPLLAEKPPAPNLKLSLEELGFPGYSAALMRTGAFSMSTIHLLDSTHVLFTYSLRSLVPRLPGDDENDTDRLVAAEVVELPTGKILARTQWHLHDHGRYLWRVGKGVFVLRSGDELSLFAPMHGLSAGTAFQRYALPHRPGRPRIVMGSPDDAILTLEVQRAEEKSASGDGEGQKTKHTTIEFYRISAPDNPDAPIELKAAGVVGSPGLLWLSLDGDGYLWAESKNRSNWSVTFNEYEGKPQNLAALHSSCAPKLSLLSRGEFLAETCRGGDNMPMLSVYGFDGHENWQEPFGQVLQPPTLVSAPAGGRFALSRLFTATSVNTSLPVLSDEPMSQEIRVYQSESGDLLLRLQCGNPVRTAENFDLSPDGSTLAVLGQKAIEIYQLRPLTDQDRKEMADVQAMTPPVSHGPVVLARITRPVDPGKRGVEGDEAAASENPESSSPAADAVASAATAPNSTAAEASSRTTGAADPGGSTAAAAAPASSLGAASGGSAAVQRGGEPVADAPRKPPTLLGPGETAEFRGASGRPQ